MPDIESKQGSPDDLKQQKSQASSGRSGGDTFTE